MFGLDEVVTRCLGVCLTYVTKMFAGFQPMCIKRSRWKSRGKFFSEFGVQVNSSKPDMSSTVSYYVFIPC